MLRATLTTELARVVLEQEEAALGVGELDDGVDDRLEQPRQAQLAVEALVDAQQAAQARLGRGGAGRERDVAGAARRGAPSAASQVASGSASRPAR